MLFDRLAGNDEGVVAQVGYAGWMSLCGTPDELRRSDLCEWSEGRRVDADGVCVSERGGNYEFRLPIR